MDYLVILGFWAMVLAPCMVAMSGRQGKGEEKVSKQEEKPHSFL